MLRNTIPEFIAHHHLERDHQGLDNRLDSFSFSSVFHSYLFLLFMLNQESAVNEVLVSTGRAKAL